MGESGIRDDPRSRRPFSGSAETATRLGAALAFLWLFLVGVKALESGISTFGDDFVDQVFSSVTNPVAGLAAGVLATVLVQSSSVTTSTIVGLVGAGVLPVETAVPMVMGANIGTTITNTLASLGHVRQGAYFERAFAAATVHDYFNLLAVAVLLPLEIVFGLVSRIARGLAGIVGGLIPSAGTGDSPIKTAVKAPVEALMDVVGDLGWQSAEGAILLTGGILLIFMSLWGMTRQMKIVMSGRIESAINGILARGAGAAALLAGLVMTVAVQSSSITTSILVPLVAAGVLTLDNAFPITLGANVGTTVTALLASMATESPDALVIALAHVTFNVLGILIFYPYPTLRRIPIELARRTGRAVVQRKSIVAVYVIGTFIVVPLSILLMA